ncbi:hypothetical protein PIB30_039498 [Stylosanthes scabra]|uniref:DUF674 domain-containing protein n=1 Tax=Stylosanthes scabra TaxID=79078 RepID=A0ABU6YD67_9FABA|nr:hypothetical protein [Stylosanthes scabra]
MAWSSSLRMKLLVDTKSEKVVFAEASKDVVDFLFTLLQLPLGTVVKLLTKKAVGGSLGKLYSSVENLDSTYMQPNTSKNLLIDPYVPTSSTLISALLPSVNNKNTYAYAQSQVVPKDSRWMLTEVHYEYDDSTYVDYAPSSPKYNPSSMSSEVKYVTPPAAAGGSDGFVKEMVNYMVMDNLFIQPMSSISSITLLKNFNIKDVHVLEERSFA